jgi:hypothetical protein
MKLNKSKSHKRKSLRSRKHKSKTTRKVKSKMSREHKLRMNKSKKLKSRRKNSLKNSLKNKKNMVNKRVYKMNGGFVSSPAAYPVGEPWNIEKVPLGNYYKYNENPVVPLNFMVSTTNTL